MSDRPTEPELSTGVAPSAGRDAPLPATDAAPPPPAVLVRRALRSALLALLLLAVLAAIALAAPTHPRWHPTLALLATVAIVVIAIVRAEDHLDRTALWTIIGLAWIAFVLTGLFGLKTPAILATAALLYGWACLLRAGRGARGARTRIGRGARTAAVAWLLLATAGAVLVWRALLR